MLMLIAANVFLSFSSTLVYRKGLLGLKLAAEFLKLQVDKLKLEQQHADPLRLAIMMRNTHKIDQIVSLQPEWKEAWEGDGVGDRG
ncbi:hypothetical protein EON63_23600, partial [archaeon]